MNLQFSPVTLEDIREEVQQHLTSLPSAIDSYVEDTIRASAHFRILVDGQNAGVTSLHERKLIYQFFLAPEFRQEAQNIYREVRRLEEVQAALVPTCDELYLSHALDEYRRIIHGGYLFAASPSVYQEPPPEGYQLRCAEENDIDTIRDKTGEFFHDIVSYVRSRSLFLTLADEQYVAFGIMARGELYTGVVSIGMFVIPEHRRRGVGTATLRLLQQQCLRENLRPIAGCWYYNHASKKTLQRAGMYTQSRLLRVEY